MHDACRSNTRTMVSSNVERSGLGQPTMYSKSLDRYFKHIHMHLQAKHVYAEHAEDACAHVRRAAHVCSRPPTSAILVNAIVIDHDFAVAEC